MFSIKKFDVMTNETEAQQTEAQQTEAQQTEAQQKVEVIKMNENLTGIMFTVRYYTGCSWCSVVTMSSTGLTGKSTKYDTLVKALEKAYELTTKGYAVRVYTGRKKVCELSRYAMTHCGNKVEKPLFTSEFSFLAKCIEKSPTETENTNTTDTTQEANTDNITYTDTDSTTSPYENNACGGFVGDAKETLNNMFGLPIEELKTYVEEAKKAGVCYPYDENTDCKDCKDCINLHDCSFRGELAIDEKCEMKQPIELYVDTDMILLMNIKAILETLFERVKKFKASYTWCDDNGNSSLRESKNKYYSIPQQSFTIFGDVYTLEFTVEYKRTSVYKYTYYTKNEKRVKLTVLKKLYKKVCDVLERKYNINDM